MYKKGVQGWLKHLDFILLDLVCLHFSFLLACIFRKGICNPYAEEIYWNIGIVLTLAGFGVAILFRTFKNVLKRGYYKEFAITLKHICLVEAVIITYMFTVQESASYSRMIIYMTGVIYVILGYTTRILWKRHLLKCIDIKAKRSLLIITTEDMVEEVTGNILAHNYEQFYIAGIVILNCDMCGKFFHNIPVVATVENAANYVCYNWIDEVFIVESSNFSCPEELTEQLLEMGVVVHTRLFHISDLKEQKRFVERLSNYTVLTRSINYATPLQQFAKRLMDILGGIVGCILTCILFVILAPIIYSKSPGPIFFVQERVGQNGKHFKMYKFRSMYLDAEERKKEFMEQNRCKDGMMFKLDADPRIIGCKILPDGTVKKGIGNYMRDYSLDEFPQFFNVLKGDMSLVGTRPPTVDEWEKYQLHHRARMASKPGITGLWQVSGRSKITDFEEVVKLDTKYIMEWSMGLDFRILLKTLLVVFGKDGAM